MKAVADYVHSKGLKLGIYSSPGPWTCGRYTATYQHEKQDAEMFAKWGIEEVQFEDDNIAANGERAKRYFAKLLTGSTTSKGNSGERLTRTLNALLK
jgi:alpha-galactosidase